MKHGRLVKHTLVVESNLLWTFKDYNTFLIPPLLSISSFLEI